MRNTYSPKRRKRKQKNILIPLTAFCVSAILALSAIAQPSWAWFMDSKSAGVEAIAASRFALTITVQCGEETVTPDETTGLYRLEANREYTVSAAKTGDSDGTGYCVAQYSGGDGEHKFYSDPVANTLTFTICPSVDSDWTIGYAWGAYHAQGGEEAPLVEPDKIEAGGTIGGGDPLAADEIPDDMAPMDETISPEETTGPTEETTAPTEETTEPTEEETTAPTEEETTAPTEEETTAPTEEETTAPTEEETTAPTEEETTAPTEEKTAPTEEETTAPTEEIVSYTEVQEPAAFSLYMGDSTIHDVPLIFQTDYPNVRYGAGSIKTSGCGIVSLTMVANYLTGHDYDPVDMARWFGGTAENNIARMENGANALQLPWSRAENFDYTMAALQDGKIVIAMMETGSMFTETQHFIVLTGLTEDGKIMVNDSFEPNYEKWDLKKGFESGFAQGQILQGYSGGWIFDPEEMPEEPFIYEKARAAWRENYPGVELTMDEQELIAKVIWVEAQGESAEGQQAVAEIVLNRLISGQFGDTVNDVIYSEGQFRSVPRIPDATPWQAQYDALDAALYGEPILPKDVYYFAREATNENVWGRIGGHIFCYG